MPLQTTFLSAQPSAGSCGYSNFVVTCNIGSLGVGVSKEVFIETTVASDFLGLLYNEASVFAAQADPIPMDNVALEVTLVTSSIFFDGFESGDTVAWSSASP